MTTVIKKPISFCEVLRYIEGWSPHPVRPIFIISFSPFYLIMLYIKKYKRLYKKSSIKQYANRTLSNLITLVMSQEIWERMITLIK